MLNTIPSSDSLPGCSEIRGRYKLYLPSHPACPQSGSLNRAKGPVSSPSRVREAQARQEKHFGHTSSSSSEIASIVTTSLVLVYNRDQHFNCNNVRFQLHLFIYKCKFCVALRTEKPCECFHVGSHNSLSTLSQKYVPTY